MIMSAPSKKTAPSKWGGENERNASMESGEVSALPSSKATGVGIETIVDGKLCLNDIISANEKEPLHTGKWTDEEMAYAEGLIDEFKAGNLALPDGTSLRQFLAKMLNCSPKRISKRYEGNNYSKGRKFYVKSNDKLAPVEAERRRAILTDLERKYKQKLMHLKMPHLLLASRTADASEEAGRGSGQGTLRTNHAGVADQSLPSTTSTAQVPHPTVAGLPTSIRAQTLSNPAALSSLRMDRTGILNQASLFGGLSSLPPSTLRATTAPMPGSLNNTSLARGLTDDASTLDLLSQLRAQEQDKQRLSALLEAQARMRLNTSTDLARQTLGLQQDILGQSSLLRELPLLASAQSQSRALDAAIAEQRLQALLHAEQLRSASALSVARAPASESLGLHTLAAIPPPATRPFLSTAAAAAATQQQSEQLQSLLQWQRLQTQSREGLGGDLAAVGGQKRGAEDADLLQRLDGSISGGSGSARRRRLDDSGEGSSHGWNITCRGPLP